MSLRMRQRPSSPAVKRNERIVPDLALEAGEFGGGDVRQIGDNRSEASVAGRKKIRFAKRYFSIQGMPSQRSHAQGLALRKKCPWP